MLLFPLKGFRLSSISFLCCRPIIEYVRAINTALIPKQSCAATALHTSGGVTPSRRGVRGKPSDGSNPLPGAALWW